LRISSRMRFFSQKETYDSNTPSGSSSRTSANRVPHKRSSKATIQSHEESISNFSVRTATPAIHKDVLGLSGQGPLPPDSNYSSHTSSGRAPSISDCKSFESLQKPTFGFRNQSVSTIREPESNHSSTATSTSKQKFRSLNLPSLENEADSSLPSTRDFSRAIAPTLITDPSPSPVHAVPPSAYPEVSKFVDGSFVPTVSLYLYGSPQPPSDSSKRPAPLPPRKVHSGGPQVVSTSHPPASYHIAPSPPQPAQHNIDRSNSQRSVYKRVRSDALVRAHTTKDLRSPGPPASVKAPAREPPSPAAADLGIKSQATVVANGQVAERRAPQPPTASQRQSAAVINLAKITRATPLPSEKKKEDADMVKRLQQICMDTDPTRLYRNLVKIGQG
jgi:hypothetical protein